MMRVQASQIPFAELNNRHMLIRLWPATLVAALAALASDLESHTNAPIYGIDAVLSLQDCCRSEHTDMVIRAASPLGFELIPVGIIALLCAAPLSRRAFFLAMDVVPVVLFLWCAMAVFKMTLAEPRPVLHPRWLERTHSAPTGSAASFAEEFSFPSGHAWATTAYWLVVLDHFPERSAALRPAAAAAVGVTALSRVWFAMHYPHDVLAGIALGFLTFRWRLWLQVFHRGTLAVQAAQWALWLAFLVCVATPLVVPDRQQRLRQRALFFGTGALLACLVLRNRAVRVVDNSAEDASWPRVALGVVARAAALLLPLGACAVAARMLLPPEMRASSDSPTDGVLLIGFGSGFVVAWWVLAGAPKLWLRLGLGTAAVREAAHSSHVPQDAEETEKSKRSR
jgi:membrane-associated phospholipid phosphatase